MTDFNGTGEFPEAAVIISVFFGSIECRVGFIGHDVFHTLNARAHFLDRLSGRDQRLRRRFKPGEVSLKQHDRSGGEFTFHREIDAENENDIIKDCPYKGRDGSKKTVQLDEIDRGFVHTCLVAAPPSEESVLRSGCLDRLTPQQIAEKVAREELDISATFRVKAVRLGKGKIDEDRKQTDRGKHGTVMNHDSEV